MIRAEELDPLSLILKTDLGVYYCFTGQFDRAIAQLGRVLGIDPNFVPARKYLGLSYQLERAYAERSNLGCS
jgi:tetratricopeptide (TPR) repeat protein